MHKGGVHFGSGGGLRDGGHGGRRGGRRGGGGKHPSGLSGKAIGMWYATRGKEKKRQREQSERAVVTMSNQREEKINRLLGDLRHQNRETSCNATSGSYQEHLHTQCDVFKDGDEYTPSHNNYSSPGRSYDRRQSWKHGNIESTSLYSGKSEEITSSDYNSRYMNRTHPGQQDQGWGYHGDKSSSGFHHSNHGAQLSRLGGNADIEGFHGDTEIDSLGCYGTRDGCPSSGRTGGGESARRKEQYSYDESYCEDHSFDVDVPGSSSIKDDDADYDCDDEFMEGDMLCGFDEILSSGQQEELTNQQLPNQELLTTPLQRDGSLDETFLNDLSVKNTTSKSYKEMQNFREKLPSFQMKEELLHVIAYNQVVVISGETGCGKTTQVAQFILDEAINGSNGSLCRIACTQPRRISAISVAERVANERGEPCGGGSVGYQIRLESKLPRPRGSIIYCTTGVLLRWLVSDPLLKSTSHVIIDEIHERDLMSDFLLVIVKDLLPRRPDLKLILMSATLNAEMFSSFFGDCPMAHIPGFTYPVKEFYIEEVIEMTRFQVSTSQGRSGFGRGRGHGRGMGPKWKNNTRRKSPAKDRRAMKMGLFRGEEQVVADEEVQWREYLGTLQTRYRRSTIETLENMDLDQIDFELAVKLIQHICINMEDGAILVFMPGWEDISKLHDGLKKILPAGKFLLIPLHSLMPTANQRQVFDRPPRGVRKIVIATNIAETSVTIDDVVFVVDCGKVKEKSYDATRKISCLMPVWISTASSRQRRGRAGRVQPGYCFHLFTELQAQSFIDYQLPEMLRTPLEELCLQIKILKLGMVSEFLSKALQPPSPLAVQNALDVLKQLNALDAHENLTPLGHHLAALPVDPRLGKMILFGAILSCLDPVLTVASTMGFKEPFVCPLEKKKQADRVRARFAGDSCSDHIAVLNAYRGWETANQHGNASTYCWENYLSVQTLKMLSNMRVQFARLLCSSGFLDSSDPKDHAANCNTGNLKLVKAVLCAGLYPNVVKIEHHAKFKRPPKLYTQGDDKVALHPKSVNADVTVFQNDWLIYHQKIKSSKVFIHDCTMIAPFPLLFFGGSISVMMEERQEIIAIDNFIKFKSPRRIAHLVKELRNEFDKLLERKIAQPGLQLSADSRGSSLLCAITELITSEESISWKRRRAMEQLEQRR